MVKYLSVKDALFIRNRAWAHPEMQAFDINFHRFPGSRLLMISMVQIVLIKVC